MIAQSLDANKRKCYCCVAQKAAGRRDFSGDWHFTVSLEYNVKQCQLLRREIKLGIVLPANLQLRVYLIDNFPSGKVLYLLNLLIQTQSLHRTAPVPDVAIIGF